MKAVVNKNCKSVASQQNYYLVFCSETAVVQNCKSATRRQNYLVVLLLHADVFKLVNPSSRESTFGKVCV